MFATFLQSPENNTATWRPIDTTLFSSFRREKGKTQNRSTFEYPIRIPDEQQASLPKAAVRRQIVKLGCHFDCNEVKGEISDSRKVWNFRLHRLGEFLPAVEMTKKLVERTPHCETCSRTAQGTCIFPHRCYIQRRVQKIQNWRLFIELLNTE